MRVLMLSWEYPPHTVGGLGKHVMELAPALAANACDITVCTPQLRGGAAIEQVAPNLTVYRIPTPESGVEESISFVQAANDMLTQAALNLAEQGAQFDLIHTHDWLTAKAAIDLKHQWQLPLIVTIHATERGRGQGYLTTPHAEQINEIEWKLTYEAWRVIACSEFMAQQIHDFFQTPRDKVDVAPNGVSIRPSPFASPAERQEWRSRFATNQQPLAFYVGRVVYEKGLQTLLEAWNVIHTTMPEARLLIAGTGSYLEALKERAAALALGDSVLFTGYISDEDRDRLYHSADVAIFPSLYEPFGIVALEAMAAHCPVIVADTGGLSEVVQQGISGLKVPPQEPVALAEAIQTVFHDPEAARERAIVAFHDAYTRYSWEQIALTTRAIYEQAYNDWQQSPWGRHPAPTDLS